MNKYDKQINFTTDIRRMYEICSGLNFESEYDTILKIYIACEPYLTYNLSLSDLLAILDKIGLYLYYLPDLLLVSSVLVELLNRDQNPNLENLTQGQKNWLNKKF